MPRLASFAVFYFIVHQTQALALLDRILYGEWDGKGGDKLTQSLNWLSLLVAFLALYLGRRNFPLIKSRLTQWVLLISFLILSSAWSVVPSLSTREAVLFSFTMMAAIGSATTVSVDRFMSILATVLGVCGLLSLGLRLIDPGLVVQSSGDFRGIFSQKNVFGQAMAMGALGCLHCLRAGVGPRWRNFGLLAALVISIVLSRSTTSLMTLIATCALDLFAWLYRSSSATRLLAISGAVVTVMILFAVLVAPDAFLDILGKDPTLTGRTEIWDFIWREFQERPVLGWGYQAFFDLSNPHAVELNNIVGWDVPESHNGLLEVLINLGLVGAGMYLGLIFVTLRCAVKCLQVGQHSVGMSTLLICVAVLVVGITETVLLAPVQILTALFVVLSLASERALREAQAQHAAPAPTTWLAPSCVVQA